MYNIETLEHVPLDFMICSGQTFSTMCRFFLEYVDVNANDSFCCFCVKLSDGHDVITDHKDGGMKRSTLSTIITVTVSSICLCLVVNK